MIGVYNLQKSIKVNHQFVLEVAQKTIRSVKRFHSNKYSVNIIFVNNRYIKRLNKSYLNRNYATDVIAFSMEEGQRLKDPSSCKEKALGDVYISAEKARTQAKRLGHSVKREIAILVIHGILHLTGYDDISRIDRMKMQRKTEKILNLILHFNTI